MLGEPTGNGGRMTRMLGALPFVDDPSQHLPPCHL